MKTNVDTVVSICLFQNFCCVNCPIIYLSWDVSPEIEQFWVTIATKFWTFNTLHEHKLCSRSWTRDQCSCHCIVYDVDMWNVVYCIKWKVYERLFVRAVSKRRRYSSAATYHLLTYQNKTNSVALVRKRTIPTERPPHVAEVSVNFCG
jgi:hypothetical protein